MTGAERKSFEALLDPEAFDAVHEWESANPGLARSLNTALNVELEPFRASDYTRLYKDFDASKLDRSAIDRISTGLPAMPSQR